MHRVTRVKAVNPYRLWIEFDDGVQGEVDMSTRLFGPMFEPLRDYAFFSQVSVDAFGAVAWPNHADLAPDALYRSITQSPRQ